jgi:beta-phosphoglucomutase
METIKLIIFDLDGVLLNSKFIHKKAFIDAVYKYSNIRITDTYYDEQLCGLPTKTKLKILKLPGNRIESYKQELTLRYLNNVKCNNSLKNCIRRLSEQYLLCCASNAIRSTVDLSLAQLDIAQYFQATFSNEDVVNCKPDPEIYIKCMNYTNCLPSETLIIEDSPVGEQAIDNSQAIKMMVSGPKEVTYTNIKRRIDEYCNSNGGVRN